MMHNNNNNKSSTEPDATIMLGQGDTAREVWPRQHVINIATTSCGLVVALYQGHAAVSCYHWPGLIASETYIETFLSLTEGKELKKVVIITNGIRGGDSERTSRRDNSTTIRSKVNCLVEYYMLTSARDTDPLILINQNSEPTILAANSLFSNI